MAEWFLFVANQSTWEAMAVAARMGEAPPEVPPYGYGEVKRQCPRIKHSGRSAACSTCSTYNPTGQKCSPARAVSPEETSGRGGEGSRGWPKRIAVVANGFPE